MGLIFLTLSNEMNLSFYTDLMVVQQFPTIRSSIVFHFLCHLHRLNFAFVVLIIERLVYTLSTLRPMECKSIQLIQQIYKLDLVFGMFHRQEQMHDSMNNSITIAI